MVAKKNESSADKSVVATTHPDTAAKARVNPVITGMTNQDLGLKVGVCHADKGGAAGFLPIIGWATVGNYIDAGTAAITPIVKGPRNQPTLASAATVKGYAGLFPIEATVGDITAEPGKERPV